MVNAQSWQRKDFLETESLSREEIELVLSTSRAMKEVSARDIKKVPALRGKTILNLFYEPSTRTRTSFEIAAKRLSADVINITPSASSVVKGESLRDTAKNLEALKPDIIVLRHQTPGAPHILAKILKSSVINAGDGGHEHPTQAMLDIFTIEDHKRAISGLEVAIIGDIAHSRVARSNIWALGKLGARVTVVGPKTFIPPEIEHLGVGVSYRPEEVIPKADVIMVLRLQVERHQGGFFPTIREYAKLYSLTRSRLEKAKPDVLIMHPGPTNRGIEIEPEVADGPYSVILEQVTNGLAVRMALMYLLQGGGAL